MRRLYYLADDLHACERIGNALKEAGVSDWNFHVLSRDEIGLYQHRIHAAATYHRLDVIHTGERWGMVGAAIGLLLGGAAYFTQPLPWLVDGADVVLTAAVGGLFGAWQGAIAGLSRENHKIAPFHDELEAGRHLVMVDVGDHNRARVRALMNLRFPSVRFCGGDSTFIGPFASIPTPAPGSAGR